VRLSILSYLFSLLSSSRSLFSLHFPTYLLIPWAWLLDSPVLRIDHDTQGMFLFPLLVPRTVSNLFQDMYSLNSNDVVGVVDSSVGSAVSPGYSEGRTYYPLCRYYEDLL
jgi:hypothetical protein